MKLPVILNVFLLTIAAKWIRAEDDPYQHREVLDGGRYILEWKVDNAENVIYFNVTVQSRGYVGFGLSKKGLLQGADIVIGGVRQDGTLYFSDRHGVSNFQTKVDASQDWTLHWGWESATHTSLYFCRQFETCDTDNDLPINNDALAVMWLYGESDNELEFDDYRNRGFFKRYLLDPDLVPTIINDLSNRTVDHLVQSGQLGDIKVWSLPLDLELLPQETSQICTFHKPPTKSKHHIIGFRSGLGDIELRHIHHFVFHICYAPKGVNADEFFGRYVGKPGEECYILYSPESRIPSQYCQEARHVWAIGDGATFLPPHVGIPLSENVDEYYMLQMHYDNPDEVPRIRLQFSLEIFYTDQIRQYDGGVMYTGMSTPIPGSTAIIVPPGDKSHTVYGHCASECTRKMLPETGIKLYGAILHTHLIGTGVRGLHIHNQQETATLADDNYDFNYQPVRMFREEHAVYPGDILISRCIYDATNRTRVTVGGFSTRNEMCNIFYWYYPLVRHGIFGVCSGHLRSDAYRNTLQAYDTVWSDEKREEIVTSPKHNAGLTLSEATNRLNWDENLRTQVQTHHRFLPQVSKCFDFDPESITQELIREVRRNPTRALRDYLLHVIGPNSTFSNVQEEIISPRNEYISLWPKDLTFYRPPTRCPAT